MLTLVMMLLLAVWALQQLRGTLPRAAQRAGVRPGERPLCATGGLGGDPGRAGTRAHHLFGTDFAQSHFIADGIRFVRNSI